MNPSPDSKFPSDIKWPLWREMPVPGAFLNISSGSPVKEPSTLSLFREKSSIPRASFIHLSKSLVDKPLPGSPAGPVWKEMPIFKGGQPFVIYYFEDIK
jgi:hypothetical protein